MSQTKDIDRVTALAGLLIATAARIESIEAELAAAREAYLRVEREDLPELMREVGLSHLTLTNGVEVVVSEEVTAAITEERRAAAHAWLREHNFGGLIKTLVTIPFGRGEEEEARRLAARIAEEHECSLNETVHPQTLKAFVREQVEDGKPLPFDLFGVHPFSRAKIKLPKAKK
jgi:hypothetical protein